MFLKVNFSRNIVIHASSKSSIKFLSLDGHIIGYMSKVRMGAEAAYMSVAIFHVK